jgi:hypothetical protein
MPVQHATGGLVGKLGMQLKTAFEAHKNDEITLMGGGDLPPINGGVAQLVECKFDVIKEGKEGAGNYFFFARGIVIEPKEVPGFGSVEGMGTSIIETIADTPNKGRKTIGEHIAWVMNEMRKLGIDTADPNFTYDRLEDTAALLKELRPYFRFRTWVGKRQEVMQKGNGWWVDTKGPYASKEAAEKANPFAGKEPRVTHDWRGVILDYVPPEAGAAVDDQTQAPGPKTGTATANGQATQRTAAAQPSVRQTAPPATRTRTTTVAPPPPVVEVPPLEGDLDSLVNRSNEGDLEAQGELMRMAGEAGWPEDDITGAASWEDVLKMVLEPKEGTEELPVEETVPEEIVPEVGNVFIYTPMDLKTKKPGNPVECEVKTVDARLKRVSLQSLENSKVVFKAVPWESLTLPTS